MYSLVELIRQQRNTLCWRKNRPLLPYISLCISILYVGINTTFLFLLRIRHECRCTEKGSIPKSVTRYRLVPVVPAVPVHRFQLRPRPTGINTYARYINGRTCILQTKAVTRQEITETQGTESTTYRRNRSGIPVRELRQAQHRQCTKRYTV